MNTSNVYKFKKNNLSNNMTNQDYAFKARTEEAYTIKSLSEVLQNILTDVCFTFNKDGIKLLTVDNKKPPQLLVHLKLGGEAFHEYICPKPLSVGINLQHLYKMLKSIKKKDTIELFILKSEPGLLNINTIQSDTNQPVTSQIKIQKLNQIDVNIPTDYGHPVHISTGTYQKMCKDMLSVSSTIHVYSKGSHLRFSCEVENMYKRAVPFGEHDEDSNDDEYEDKFYTKSLNQLIKVSGLNTRMQVYIPLSDSAEEMPLKIGINAGQLGKLEIYIKSVKQIEG